MSGVSAIVLCRDEDPGDVRRCVLRLRPFVDEVVLADSSSTPACRNAAESVGAKAHELPFEGSFSDLRSRAMRGARHRWSLHCDIDEVFPGSILSIVRELADAGPWGYSFPRFNLPDGDAWPDTQVRFMDRERCRWEGLVHETIIGEGPPEPLSEPILHLPGDQARRRERHFLYRTLAHMEKERHPEETLTKSGERGPGPAVTYIGGVFDSSGYGSCIRDNILALHLAGAKVRVEALEFWTGEKIRLDDAETALLRGFESAPATRIKVHHATPDCYRRKGDSYDILYTVWEAQGLHPEWGRWMSSAQEVWTASKFCAEQFAPHLPAGTPLIVIPHCVDVERFQPRENVRLAELPKSEGKTFRFLTTFQWISRKNPEGLLDAWAQAFQPTDPVELVLRCFLNQGSDVATLERIIGKYYAVKGVSAWPRIRVLPSFLPADSYPLLYNGADAFVFPSHGEGFSIPCLEALASGCPVIATDWSAMKEYLDERNSWPVRVRGVVRPTGDRVYLKNPESMWADVDTGSIALRMKEVFEARDEAGARAEEGRRTVLERFDRAVVGPMMLRRLKDVEGLK